MVANGNTNLFLHLFELHIRYSHWIKKENDDLEQLADFIMTKESELRAHPEFDEIHHDDLKALVAFKESLGIKRGIGMAHADEETTVYDDQTATAAGTPSPVSAASSRRRLSTTGSRSRSSVQSNVSNLSPLYEEGDDDDNAEKPESPTPQKRRRLNSSRGGDNSIGSSITKSTYNPGTIEEREQNSVASDEESD